MLDWTTLYALTAALTAQATLQPDQLDLLRNTDTTPQIQLVLDSSGSMSTTMLPTPACPYYADLFLTPQDPGCTRCSSCMSDAGCRFSRMDMLKASLTGCANVADGVLDQWATHALFAMRVFGTGGNDGLTPNGGFDTSRGNIAGLKSDVLALTPNGQTPLGLQYAAAGAYVADDSTGFFSYDGDPTTPQCSPTSPGGACNNTLECRQNYIVVLSDGASNGPPSTYDFVAANPSVTVNDLSDPAPYTDLAARYMVRDVASPAGALVDVMGKVAGSQQIRTYSIAFDAPSNAQQLLSDMATEGDGAYHDATSYAALNDAFVDIFTSIIARSSVVFSAGTVQPEGFFSGNFVYVSSFRPFEDGYWPGTTKKYCVDPNEPPILDPANTECMFLRVPATPTGQLFTNPAPVDRWTLTAQASATVGGSGARIAAAMGANPTTPYQFPGSAGCPSCSPAVAPQPGSPYGGRRVLTWEPGKNNYLEITDSTFAPPSFSRSSGACNHARLINKLYGYTDEVRGPGCSGNDLWPAAYDVWPVGDTVNGSATMIAYSNDCETAGNCYIAVNANDGAMHFLDAATGDEISMVIPGNFFVGDQSVTNEMSQLMDQPNGQSMRRYYFDGKSRLYHEDSNANGYIDASETAYFIAGLGRGGKMYLQWDMSMPGQRFHGDPLGGATAPATGSHPPSAIMVDSNTGFAHLRDTWAAPWVGQFVSTVDQAAHRTAIFPSGHTGSDDVLLGTFASTQPGLGLPPDDNNTYDANPVCSDVGIAPEACDPTVGINSICTAYGVPTSYCDFQTCTPGYTGALFANNDPADKPCYDDPIWASLAGSGPNPNPLYGANFAPGYARSFGPYSFASGSQTGRAFRLVFARLDLQPGDRFEILDDSNTVVETFDGPQPTGTRTQWVYGSSFSFRLITDGSDSGPASLWAIDRIHVQRTAAPGNITATTEPTVFFVDLDRVASYPFAAVPTDDRQGSALLARITRDCSGTAISGTEHCVDQTSQPDLAYMTCPISAPIAVYTEGGRYRTGYVGDECGQIWAIDRNPRDAGGAAAWTVRRLVHLNNVDASGHTVLGDSADFRKIFARLDLVISTCTNQRAIGVYFGTGDVQRPATTAGVLQDPAVTNPNQDTPSPTSPLAWPAMTASGDRNVFGVVWDDTHKRNLRLSDLFDATTVANTDPGATKTKNGFFMRLRPAEKMLRDPLVIDGVAYFKTYRPTKAATECVSARGLDQVYAFDNCTAAPTQGTTASGREVWSGETEIGGGLMLYAPRGGPPAVLLGGTGSDTPELAALPSRPDRRVLRLYLWRLDQ